MSQSAGDLRALAADRINDAVVINEVKYELSFRTTKAARVLLAEVKTGVIASKDARVVPARTDYSIEQRLDVSPSAGDECSDLRVRYEELRQTFTERGSSLSKWGMTELMPPEMVIKVVALWKLAVDDVADKHGRSKTVLSADMKKLGIDIPGLGIQQE